MSLNNNSSFRTGVNNDLEGPEKGCEILRYIDPMPHPPLGGLLLTILEKKLLSLSMLYRNFIIYHCIKSEWSLLKVHGKLA